MSEDYPIWDDCPFNIPARFQVKRLPGDLPRIICDLGTEQKYVEFTRYPITQTMIDSAVSLLTRISSN